MKKAVFITIGVVLLIGAVVLIVLSVLAEDAIPISTMTVERKTVVQSVSASGKVQPIHKVDISAYVSAEIVELPVSEGQSVKKGELLCALDSTRYQASRDQLAAAKTAAGSQVRLARANMEQARRDVARAIKLHQEDLISDAELETAQTKTEVMEATLKSSRDRLRESVAGLRLAGDDLSKTMLSSPIDGVIIALNKEVGEIVMGSQLTRDIIMTVADLSAMELVVEVDENDVPDLKVGQAAGVEVDAFPKEEFHGSVTAIANSAKVKGRGTQEETTSFDVTITLTGDVSRLRPGMSATTKITTQTRQDVLALPIQCLTMRDPNADPGKSITLNRTDNLRDVVFRMLDGEAKMLLVTTGISSEFDIQVEGEIHEGDEIVCGPYKTLNRKLKDGDPIEIGDQASDGEEK